MLTCVLIGCISDCDYQSDDCGGEGGRPWPPVPMPMVTLCKLLHSTKPAANVSQEAFQLPPDATRCRVELKEKNFQGWGSMPRCLIKEPPAQPKSGYGPAVHVADCFMTIVNIINYFRASHS